MPEPVIGLVGMKALRRDINHLAEDVRSPLYRAIKDAGRRAVEPVAAATRGSLPRSGRPDNKWHQGGALAADVRVSATKTGAGVRMGRKRLNYAGWVEFGGTRHRPHDSQRVFVRDGRYLYAAARDLAPVVSALYANALEQVFSSPSVWTNSGVDASTVHD